MLLLLEVFLFFSSRREPRDEACKASEVANCYLLADVIWRQQAPRGQSHSATATLPERGDIVPLVGEQAEQPGVEKDLLPAHGLLLGDAGGGEGLEVARRRLTAGDALVHQVGDAARVTRRAPRLVAQPPEEGVRSEQESQAPSPEKASYDRSSTQVTASPGPVGVPLTNGDATGRGRSRSRTVFSSSLRRRPET